MATGIIWADGFDWYTTDAILGEMYTPSNTSFVEVSTAHSRHASGRGLLVYQDGGGNRSLRRSIPTTTEVIVGCALRVNPRAGFGSIANVFAVTGDVSGFPQVQVVCNGLTFSVYRGNVNTGTTLLGTSSAMSTTLVSNWHYLEFRIKASNTVGEVEIKADGVQILNLTSLDTYQYGTTPEYSGFLFGQYESGLGAGVNYDLLIDDVVAIDKMVGGAAFLGPVRVEALFPSAAGTTTEFTPSAGSNYDCVNETDTDDLDYVSASAPVKKDTYAVGNLTQTSGTVHSVTTLHRARSDGGRTVAAVVRSGANETDGTSRIMGSTFSGYLDVFDTKPGGGSWAVSDVNGMEAGVKLVS